MAYTAVKLADVQAAIAKVTAAQKKYDTAKKSVDPSKSAANTAKTKLEEAQKKLESMRNDFDKQTYLKGNSTYDKAVSTYNDAVKKAKGLEDTLNNQSYLKSDTKYQDALKAVSEAQKKVETARNYIESNDYLKKSTTYQSAVTASEKAKKTLETANNYLDSGDYRNKSTEYQNAVKARQTAEKNFENARNFLDSNDYLKQNSTYQNAVKAIGTAEDNRRKAEDALNNANDKNRKSLETALNNANKAVDTAYTNKDKAETAARTAAEKARNTAEATFNTASSNVEKADNTARVAAEKARNAADTAYGKSQQLIDTEANKARTAAEASLNTLQKAYDTSNSGLDTAANNARVATEKLFNAANLAVDTSNKTVETTANTLQAAAQKAIDTQDQLIGGTNKVVGLQTLYDKANEAYENTLNQIQPDLDARNDAINNVNSYAQTLKDTFGDVKNINDAKEFEKLFGEIKTAVNGAGVDDLKNQFNSQLSGFDPMKAFNEKLPQLKQEYNQSLELPTLSASQVDAALNRMGTNEVARNGFIGDGNSIYVPSKQARGDDLAQYAGKIDGLNLKSVNANILTGAALFGVYKDLSQKGKVGYIGDFNKAAQAAGVDISGMSKQDAYNAINEKGQGFYTITTRGSLAPDPATGKTVDHWSALYKKEGDNLVPVTDNNGSKVVQGFSATWHQPYEDFSTFIQGAMPAIMMALPFVLPGVGNAVSSALGNVAVSSAVAPTAFTVGAPALTLSTAVGATAVSAAANAAVNAVVTKLLNPDASGMDIVKSAGLSAVSTLSAGNSAKIVENIGISADTVNQIAAASKLSPSQVNEIIANGVTKTAAGIATGDPNAATNIAASVAGQFVGYEAQNLVADALKTADPKLLQAAVSAAGNVANVVTQTVIKDGDVNAALINAAPDILTSSAEAAAQTTKTPAPIEERSTIAEPELTAGLTAEQLLQAGAGTKPEQASGLQPRAGETAGEITSEKLEDGSIVYRRVITGKTSDDTPYSYTAYWDPADPRAPYTYQLSTGVSNDPRELEKGVVVQLTTTRPEFDTEAAGIQVTKPTDTTGIATEDLAPIREITPQQKADNFQKQAEAAKEAVLAAANNYIQNPTPTNKAVVDKAVLDAEIAQKSADLAQANLSTTTTPSNVPSNVSSGASTSTIPSNTISTSPGSGTSNQAGDSAGVISGLGGIGTGGTGIGGTGTSGIGTGIGTGIGAGSGTGTGAGTGTGIGTGSGTVSTGGLNQMYTTTPLAKRPIGDLYPLSHTMMTPEEIAARSTTQMVRRGGLVSVR